MNKKHTPLLIVMILILLAAGCSPAANVQPETVDGQALPVQAETKIYDRGAWNSYSAMFQIQFTGAANWTYRLKTRNSPLMREFDLHIEGVSGEQNPGDIRMVTDGATTWMIGPGTDNECIQFPNSVGMDPEFIDPEVLVDPQEVHSLLELVGEEAIGGVAAQHYQYKSATAGPWKDPVIDVWADKANKMLLLFTFTAAGEDPFFGAGAGNVSAIYASSEFGSEPIQPVTGCDIAVPLPEAAEMFVRLPGMASFQTPTSSADIQNFYQTALPQEEWAEYEPPAQAEAATILSYRRGAEIVEVHIQSGEDGGSRVQLLFMVGQ